MRARKLNNRTIIIALVGILLISSAALILGGGLDVGGGSAADLSGNDHNFPKVQINYKTDKGQPQNVPWTPIQPKTPVCVDWLLYHHSDTDDGKIWNIERVGVNDQKPTPMNVTKTTTASQFNIAPSLSPDGQWIAFTSNKQGNANIFVSTTDGSQTFQVTYFDEAVNLNPMWSPDGKFIVFESTRDGDLSLYLHDVTAATSTDDIRLTDYPASNLDAFWAPDGSKLIFESNRDDGKWQIYEILRATHAEKRLSDGNGDDRKPSYSFDGKQITFVTKRDGTNNLIATMNADGSGVKVISDKNGNADNPVWSPDGKLIAYQIKKGLATNIYIYDVASGKTRQLTNTRYSQAPTWLCSSPNTVAFTSELGSASQIFTASALPIDGSPIDIRSGAHQLTFDGAANQYPTNWPTKQNASRQIPNPKN